ncbi:MAG: hypothetical protein AB8B77_04735 [Alphaproteobacteria bacterium]
MFDFEKYNALIDQNAVEEVLEILNQPAVKTLPPLTIKYLFGLVNLIAGRVSIGIELLRAAVNEGTEEKMIAEAASAAATKLGMMAEGIYFAKISSILQIGQIKSMPKIIGNFDINFSNIQDNVLLRSAKTALKDGKYQSAYQFFENLALLESDNPVAWQGVVSCAAKLGHSYSALQAALPLFRADHNGRYHDLVIDAILNAKGFDRLEELPLENLSLDKLDLLTSSIEANLEIDDMLAAIPRAHDPKLLEAHLNKRPDALLLDIETKPEADILSQWRAKIKDHQSSHHNILVYADFNQNHNTANFILDLLAEYSGIKSTIMVFNETDKGDSVTEIYANIFADWVNVEKIDDETLIYMVEKINPTLIINIQSRIGHGKRPYLFNDAFKEKFKAVPIFCPAPHQQDHRPLFDSLETALQCTVIPRLIQTPATNNLVENHINAHQARTQGSNPDVLILPPLIHHCSVGFFELFEGDHDKQVGFLKNALDQDRLAGDEILQNLGLIDQDQLEWVKFDLEKQPHNRYVCFDVWGQAQYFIDCFNQGIIPDLVVPLGLDPAKSPAYLMQALYYLLGLESRIVYSLDDLWALPPIDEALIKSVEQRFYKVTSKEWRSCAAIAFLTLMQTHIDHFGTDEASHE